MGEKVRCLLSKSSPEGGHCLPPDKRVDTVYSLAKVVPMNNALSYREALEVLEDDDRRLECNAECRAEAGMGAVSMGFSGYDGMTEWDMANPGPGADYFERLAEAREVVAAFPVKVTYRFPTRWQAETARAALRGEEVPALPF
jgi:hypothetical protein